MLAHDFFLLAGFVFWAIMLGDGFFPFFSLYIQQFMQLLSLQIC